MSMKVAIDEIEAVAASYGPAAYVLVSSADGPPRVTHVTVGFDGTTIVVSLGRSAAGAIADNPRVCVLWSATDQEPMSLIVDGTVVSDVDVDEGGEVRIEPTGAVRHRPAPV